MEENIFVYFFFFSLRHSMTLFLSIIPFSLFFFSFTFLLAFLTFAAMFLASYVSQDISFRNETDIYI